MGEYLLLLVRDLILYTFLIVYFPFLSFQATGCILTELILKKRIIGYSKSDQLDEIFKVFGTPKSFEW